MDHLAAREQPQASSEEMRATFSRCADRGAELRIEATCPFD
jgi:hypothetical protein